MGLADGSAEKRFAYLMASSSVVTVTVTREMRQVSGRVRRRSQRYGLLLRLLLGW
jgi:hypothetical protein